MSNELTLFDYGTLPVNDAMALSAIKERIKIRLKRTAEDIIEIGLDLIEAKRIAGHGGFENWLKAEFEMSLSSATKLMQVGSTFGDSKSVIITDLKPTALYMLAAPSTPESVRTEVIERVENGESINLAEIQRLKKEAADLLAEKETVQNDLIAKTQTADELQRKVNFQKITVDSVEKQNTELRDKANANIDAAVDLLAENNHTKPATTRATPTFCGIISALKT